MRANVCIYQYQVYNLKKKSNTRYFVRFKIKRKLPVILLGFNVIDIKYDLFLNT